MGCVSDQHAHVEFDLKNNKKEFRQKLKLKDFFFLSL